MTSWNEALPIDRSKGLASQVRGNMNALAASLFGQNLLADPEMRIWAAGDTAVPTCFFVAGSTPASITRCGLSLGDTNRKFGPYCMKIVGGAGNTYFGQYIVPPVAGIYGWSDSFTGLEFGAGVYVKTADVNGARVGIGETTTSVDAGSFHTGSDNWEWLRGPRHVVGAATVLAHIVEIGAGKTVYVSAPTATIGGVPPLGPLPCPAQYGVLYFKTTGDFAVGTLRDVYHPARPGIVKDVMFYAKTAPTGASLIADVNTWDGAALTSMFSTRPTITAGSNQNSARPDSTYARRCLAANFGTTAVGNVLTVDIDQVGSSVPGADGYLGVRVLQYTRAFEGLAPFDFA